eukprot:1158877-Pelagomonas_calceolata.AAC.6
MSGGSWSANSLKVLSSGPSSSVGELRRMDRMAWVAHALGITCDLEIMDTEACVAQRVRII